MGSFSQILIVCITALIAVIITVIVISICHIFYTISHIVNAVLHSIPCIFYSISSSINGITGSIAFDENGDAAKDTAYIKGVDNATGEFTFVKMQTVADLG